MIEQQNAGFERAKCEHPNLYRKASEAMKKPAPDRTELEWIMIKAFLQICELLDKKEERTR